MKLGGACAAAAAVTALAAFLTGGNAAAHEVLHTVERGRAVALKAFFADGEVMAYVPYEIYSPRDARIPYQKGRTDRGGHVAFVPDVPGQWRVKVTDETGHGLDTLVETGPAATVVQATPGSAAFVLRPLAGAAAIGLIFGALLLFHRRRGRGRS